MNDTIKRKRSINFTQNEKELLLEIAIPKRMVLEDKTANAITWKIKEGAWEEIATQFNSQTQGTVSIDLNLRHFSMIGTR